MVSYDSKTNISTSAGQNYSLECHNLSYIRSFTTGKWYTKIFNPPITAQFLKDVSLELHAGEVMGVMGSAGSGKTTLLSVIARRVQGTTGGGILLNHRPMTERTFQNNCAYVSFKQHLFPSLTVKETLTFQADLALAPALPHKDKHDRVIQLMRDFELIDHAPRQIKSLSESARRRLLIALHLIRDPILVTVDEPCQGLDALSSYQLMYCLFQYTKRYNRMVMVSIMMPRSDIYQLFDRITLLFFGEVLYSGYTKQMPGYFRQIGYPCPASENPAIYFLSLATVDRETSERYLETQDQAVKLIEIFKTQGYAYSQYKGGRETHNQQVVLPLSHLGRPGAITKMFTLCKRSMRCQLGRKCLLLCRLLLLPLFSLVLFGFYSRLTTSPTSPQTRAGLIFNIMTGTSIIAAAITAESFGIERLRYYQESWDNLYTGSSFIIAQLLTPFLLDLLMIFASSAILFWTCKMGIGSIVHYLIVCGVLWACYQFSMLQTMILMVFVRSSYKSACISMTLLMILLIWSGGFLKSLRTYDSSNDWLYFLSYASIFRYASVTLHYQEMRNLNITECQTATQSFNPTDRLPCRWASGMQYLEENFQPESYSNPWLNFGLNFTIVGVMTIICFTAYVIPMPNFVKRKFRYK